MLIRMVGTVPQVRVVGTAKRVSVFSDSVQYCLQSCLIPRGRAPVLVLALAIAVAVLNNDAL